MTIDSAIFIARDEPELFPDAPARDERTLAELMAVWHQPVYDEVTRAGRMSSLSNLEALRARARQKLAALKSDASGFSKWEDGLGAAIA